MASVIVWPSITCARRQLDPIGPAVRLADKPPPQSTVLLAARKEPYATFIHRRRLTTKESILLICRMLLKWAELTSEEELLL